MDANRFFDMVASTLACDRPRAKALTAVVLPELRDGVARRASRGVMP